MRKTAIYCLLLAVSANAFIATPRPFVPSTTVAARTAPPKAFIG